ncbi:MAG: glycosyltransferase family 2 protein [Clostridia bacterium]|nr:glycosyltransferase family 2 protein [Clostridia bacterium]
MPVFQAQAYLKDAIDSVLSQSYSDFELLIFNDGSTDKSGAICRAAAEQDKRIRYFEQENRGQAAVRNHGIREARGEYLAFADSDDLCRPDWLRTLFDRAQATGAEIVLCGYQTVSGETVSDVFSASGTMNDRNLSEKLPELKQKNLMDPPWNKLYRTDFVRRTGVQFPEGEIYEDTEFNLRLLQYHPTVEICSECLYCYLLHAGSTTRRYDERKWPTLQKRVAVLRELLPDCSPFCDYCWLRFFYSSFADMFLSLSGKEVRRRLKAQLKTEEFYSAAHGAVGQGMAAKLTVWIAKSRSVGLIYSFCRMTFWLKYKMQKLFFRVRK